MVGRPETLAGRGEVDGLVFPALNVKRALPLNEPMAIEFTPAKAEDIAFVCGTNMLKGAVIVQ